MRFEEYLGKFNINLTDQQQEAVRTVDGPVLLLAVPGSGKTTVLTARLGYMFYARGIAPESVLTLTYTRSAARDMAERFAALFGELPGPRPEFRTINGICDSVIRYYSNTLGKNAFALESNEKNINARISAIYREATGTFANESDIHEVRTLITYIKNMCLNREEIDGLGDENDLGKLWEIYSAYRAGMRRDGLMDYDDQLVYAYNILKSSSETLEYFQDKYRYICVDEAQDTSRIQHMIIGLLAGKNRNLFMVGDEDQSIYGFRAAYPDALLKFEEHYPGARVLLMEENFRSNSRIVEGADRFIQKNVSRHKKSMRAFRALGSDIRLIEIAGRRAQYAYLLKVAESVNKDSAENASGPDEEKKTARTAVLYRNNENALPLIDILERRGIPYRMAGRDILFFTNRVVQDIRNIIGFAADQYNTELFMQIYYKLNLYVKRDQAEAACRMSNEQSITVLDALEKYCIQDRQKKYAVRALRTNLDKMLQENADKAITRITDSMEYGSYLERMGLSQDKVYTLKCLGRNEKSPLDLLERLDYLRDTIRDKEYDPQCRFVLSTIHSSKGLEYENVYIMDAFDGIFPAVIPEKDCDDSERSTYEEERRMFYVAATRARDNLAVFTLKDDISTFAADLTGKCKAVKKRRESSAVTHIQGGRAAGSYLKNNMKSEARPREFDEAGYAQFLGNLGPGIGVAHKRFGEGVISECDEKNAAIVFDEDGSERRFNLRLLFEKDLLKVLS